MARPQWPEGTAAGWPSLEVGDQETPISPYSKPLIGARSIRTANRRLHSGHGICTIAQQIDPVGIQSMPLRPASFCALLLLVGCATPTQPPAPKAQLAAPLVGVRGTILAMRPVPAEAPGPALILLSSLGTQGTQAQGDVFEFIVRTASGTTISVVQPRTNGLHTGERVSIQRGAETRIDAPPAD